MWLITKEQCEDIIRQENRKKDLIIPWSDLSEENANVTLGDGWYTHLVCLGDTNGIPMITCTTSQTDIAGHSNAPDEAYLATVIVGLHETYNLGRQGVAKYLASVPGVSGAWSKNKIMGLWDECCRDDEDENNEPNENIMDNPDDFEENHGEEEAPELN